MGDRYNGYGEDFKRNTSGAGDNASGPGGGGGLTEAAGQYLRSLLAEKIKLSQGSLPFAAKLLDQEVDRVKTEGRARPPERFVDVLREKPIRVAVKVMVPIKEHPGFNFVGKLLGPKGNTMKQLQEETMCKMAVLGRGSMRDKQKEEELRQSLDPKYSHLSDELHVEISAFGPPAESHARIAYALAEVRKYLIPDPEGPPHMPHMMERGPPMRPPPPHARPPPPHARPGPPSRKSILDRARVAMDDQYAYEESYERPAPPPQRAMRPAGAYQQEYYAERGERPFAYDDDYSYKPAAREYKTAAAVGTRRPARFAGARDGPYARPNKH